MAIVFREAKGIKCVFLFQVKSPNLWHKPRNWMFCMLYLSPRTNHVLSLSMFLYYLNNPVAFIMLVAESYVNLQRGKTGDSTSSHTETLTRKQLSVGCTFCIFIRLSEVEDAGWKCSCDKHFWMVGKDTIISGANPIAYPADRGRGLVPFTTLFSYLHPPPIFRNYIRTLHLNQKALSVP